MKEKIGMRVLPVLLALLLVSAMVVPTVSAAEIFPAEKSPDGSLKIL